MAASFSPAAICVLGIVLRIGLTAPLTPELRLPLAEAMPSAMDGIVGEDEIVLTRTMVQRLMGNKPEERFAFIQERAAFATEDVIDV